MARPADPAPTSAAHLVIRGVTVVDPRDGSLQAAQDVRLAGERILSIPILGHLPSGIDVARASGDGMRSIEHLGPGAGMLACCSTEQDAVDRDISARPEPKMPPAWPPIPEPVFNRVIRTIVVNPLNRSQPADVDILARAAATFAQDAAAALAQRFVRDGTWQVPTLIRSRTMHLCDDPAFREDPGLRYVAPSALRTWRKAADKFARFPASSRETFRAVYATLLALTKVLDDVGVRMLAGSDSGGAAWELPGIALHQEFDELARAGLPPLRVLQMTTSDAADFLDTADVMGSVAPGKYADLVLLDANPIESVDHLHRISGVVRGGRYYPPAELDALREKVAAGRSVRQRPLTWVSADWSERAWSRGGAQGEQSRLLVAGQVLVHRAGRDFRVSLPESGD